MQSTGVVIKNSPQGPVVPGGDCLGNLWPRSRLVRLGGVLRAGHGPDPPLGRGWLEGCRRIAPGRKGRVAGGILEGGYDAGEDVESLGGLSPSAHAGRKRVHPRSGHGPASSKGPGGRGWRWGRRRILRDSQPCRSSRRKALMPLLYTLHPLSSAGMVRGAMGPFRSVSQHTREPTAARYCSSA